MKLGLLIVSLSAISMAKTISFKQALVSLDTHHAITTLEAKAKALQAKAKLESSWGDPRLKVAAKNFPIKTLKNDQTPMTGVEIGLSQRIPISNRYHKLESANLAAATAADFRTKSKKRELIKSLWGLAIRVRKIEMEIKIFSENLIWISKMLSISKELYANGKLSQQALLEIQIRKSEIESAIARKNFELRQTNDAIAYLIGDDPVRISQSSIPWGFLDKINKSTGDPREQSLKHDLNSRQQNLSAAKLAYFPDLDFSIAYTKRSNIDGLGDFASAQLSIPLPFSSQVSANQRKAAEEKYSLEREYFDFKRRKRRDTAIVSLEIGKVETELKILDNKTIKFAKNSRAITAKSYGLGNASYSELLQSEFNFQKILLKRVALVSMRDLKKIELKYISGEPLNE